MNVLSELSPQYQHLRAVVDDIATNGVPADAVEIYRARNRVYTLQREGITLNIKAFKVASFPNNYIYTTLRRSKARRSMENARQLMAEGFHTPDPVAWIEVRDGARLKQSYYISIQLDNAADMRCWQDNPAAMAALPAMAHLLAHLHHKGVWHKDFSPGNILWTLTPDHGYRFYLIDLNRMRFGVHNRKRQMSNFAAINIESEAETAHLARLYAEAYGDESDPYLIERAALQARRHYLRRKQRLHFLKRLLHIKK